MTFDVLLDQVLSDAPRFGHREHVHLTWLAVRIAVARHRPDADAFLQ